MDQYVLRGKVKGYYKTKKGLILVLLLLLMVSLGVGIYLVQQPQILKEFAKVSEIETAVCRWHVTTSASSYRYVITNTTTNEVILQGETKGRSVTFEMIFGNTYSCSVIGINSCGVGPESGDVKVCVRGVTPTPTSTPTVTPSISLTPTATPTLPPGVTPTATPTVPIGGPSPTITPTPTITHSACRYSLCLVLPGPLPQGEQSCETDLDCLDEITPTPTQTFDPTVTPTLAPGITPTSTLTPIPTLQPTITPTPLAEELPESGFFTSTYLLFISGVISVLGGMILLRLF